VVSGGAAAAGAPEPAQRPPDVISQAAPRPVFPLPGAQKFLNHHHTFAKVQA